MNSEKILDISWSSIIKISVAVIFFYILFLIRDLLIWFLFAFIVAILFNPAIDYLQKWRIPRVVATSLVYIIILGSMGLFMYSVSIYFIDEIRNFSNNFPKYFEDLSPLLTSVGIGAFATTESFLRSVTNMVEQMGANIFNTLFVIFGGIMSTLMVIGLAFFISLEGGATIKRVVVLLFPKRYEATVTAIWDRAQKRVISWFLVRILASIFVGLASYIIFFLFAIKYPISLAIIAGVLNFIPIIGPIITGFLIFALVALDSFVMAVIATMAFILIQQIESYILTPWLSKKFVGVSPVLILFALAVGGKLWGILGAILAVPLFGVMAEFTRDYLTKKREEEQMSYPSS